MTWRCSTKVSKCDQIRFRAKEKARARLGEKKTAARRTGFAAASCSQITLSLSERLVAFSRRTALLLSCQHSMLICSKRINHIRLLQSHLCEP